MDSLTSLVNRLENVAQQLETLYSNKSNVSNSTSNNNTTTTDSKNAFKESLSSLELFLSHSKSIGGLVLEHSLLVNAALDSTSQLIEIAFKSKKPSTQEALLQVIKPLQTAIQQVTEFKDKNARNSPFVNHLTMLAEGIPALGWVVIEPAPAPYVGELKESAQFYANRVLKEYKEKDKLHVEWSNSFIQLLTDLQVYVKKNHTAGLVWNPKGNVATAPIVYPATSSNAEKPKYTPVAAPTPSSLLGEIGPNVTAGLKKVEKSQMTHKNPELRASSIVKADDVNSTPVKSLDKPVTIKAKAPPKLALEGNKWIVENYVNDSNIVIQGPETRHVVYIYNCQNSTISVKGKVNAISIDGSKKCGVLIDSVVSTIDIVNCKSTTVQILGKAPTLVIDKSDGAQVYLSKDCLDIEVLSAKSSEINVLVPNEDDFVELALPEQLKSKIYQGKVVSVAVEHKG